MSNDKIDAADAWSLVPRAQQTCGSRLPTLWVPLALLCARSPLRQVARSNVNIWLIAFSGQVSGRNTNGRDKSFGLAPSSQLAATLKTTLVAAAKRIGAIAQSRGHVLDSISQSGFGHTLTIKHNSAANLFTRTVVIQEGMPQ